MHGFAVAGALIRTWVGVVQASFSLPEASRREAEDGETVRDSVITIQQWCGWPAAEWDECCWPLHKPCNLRRRRSPLSNHRRRSDNSQLLTMQTAS